MIKQPRTRLSMLFAAACLTTQLQTPQRPRPKPPAEPVALKPLRPHTQRRNNSDPTSRECRRRARRMQCPLCRQPPGQCHPACTGEHQCE